MEPPSIKDVEKASKLFHHSLGIARDLYTDNRHVGEPAAYFIPLGLEIFGYSNLNGYADMNFQLQRVDDGAQWEIRKLARTKHNLVEEMTHGFYTKILGRELKKYVDSGAAYVEPSDNTIRFSLEQVKTKAGV